MQSARRDQLASYLERRYWRYIVLPELIAASGAACVAYSTAKTFENCGYQNRSLLFLNGRRCNGLASVNRCSAGSEVRFRQLTLWNQYRWQMSVIFAVCCFRPH